MKEPLTADEIRKLAGKVSGVRELVAPKKREEAAAVPDAKLPDWLAEDGKRMRRPIIESGAKVTLGFSKDIEANWG